ncbi:MAG: bifunctional aspartate kinase/homoserine dehydrogenase I [Myxococcota bacterium]
MGSKPGNTHLGVFKFGGTSVGSAEAIRLAVGHVKAAAPNVAVVVSAMSGITDLLLGGVQAAGRGDADAAREAARSFHERHATVIGQLVVDRARAEELHTLLQQFTDEYAAICQSVLVLRELTTRTLDGAVSRGERMLARIFTAVLQGAKVNATYVDATQVLLAERKLGSLWPDLDASRKAAREKMGPHMARKHVVIMPGYIARGPDGETVTLGRGGSDFSAAILANVLGAGSVTLYKEVDGLMTADPKAVPEARVVPEVHYREAAELAYYGAKVLHPRTMIPLIERGIPLWVKNTFNASFSGTRIGGDVEPGAYPVKALTAIRGQALVSVEGNGMMGVPGMAARTFQALAAAGLSVAMISQASSEASICLVLSEGEAEQARKALKAAFAAEMDGKLIDTIRVEKGLALVAVVGLGMRGTRGIAARTFTAMSREEVNVIAIAQGSSELNITVAIKESDVPRTLHALHREFQLEKLRPLPDTHGRDTNLAFLGFGQIARALTRQLVSQQSYFRHDLGLDIRCVAVSDRTGARVDEKGFSVDDLQQLAERKAAGNALAQRKGSRGVVEELRHRLWPLPLHRPVFVDLTADETAPLLKEALQHGFHLVTANKKPLAIPQAGFDELFGMARELGRHIRYEATVGAGLPVLDTLDKLQQAGDEVLTVDGCLSGTLGYLMTQLEQGAAFSAAVRQAHALGYTEPNPADDLSGTDVARKALILARTLGRKLDLDDIRVESLFPKELARLDAQGFMDALGDLDAEFAQKVSAARKKDKVLRYVAQIGRKGIVVGLQAVPTSSPMGRLVGTDNQVVLHTRRYSTNPLVVTGPGAGAEVTAAGVLNDILAIAQSGERQRATSGKQRKAVPA